MDVVKFIAKNLAILLDKLKIGNPIVFVFVQGLLGILLGLFANNTINIPTPEAIAKILEIVGIDSFDNFIIILLGAILAAVGPRTTALKNGSVEDTNNTPDTP